MLHYRRIVVNEDGYNDPDRNTFFKTIEEAFENYQIHEQSLIEFIFDHHRKTKEILQWLLNNRTKYWFFWGDVDERIVFEKLRDQNCPVTQLAIFSNAPLQELWKDVILSPIFKKLEYVHMGQMLSDEEIVLLDKHLPDHQLLLPFHLFRQKDVMNLIMYRPTLKMIGYTSIGPRNVWYGMFQGLLNGKVGMTFMRTVLEMMGERPQI